MKKQLNKVITIVFITNAATHDKYVFLTDVDASISPIITDLDASTKWADFF